MYFSRQSHSNMNYSNINIWSLNVNDTPVDLLLCFFFNLLSYSPNQSGPKPDRLQLNNLRRDIKCFSKVLKRYILFSSVYPKLFYQHLQVVLWLLLSIGVSRWVSTSQLTINLVFSWKTMDFLAYPTGLEVNAFIQREG